MRYPWTPFSLSTLLLSTEPLKTTTDPVVVETLVDTTTDTTPVETTTDPIVVVETPIDINTSTISIDLVVVDPVEESTTSNTNTTNHIIAVEMSVDTIIPNDKNPVDPLFVVDPIAI